MHSYILHNHKFIMSIITYSRCREYILESLVYIIIHHNYNHQTRDLFRRRHLRADVNRTSKPSEDALRMRGTEHADNGTQYLRSEIPKPGTTTTGSQETRQTICQHRCVILVINIIS